jgi:hypothetical protein
VRALYDFARRSKSDNFAMFIGCKRCLAGIVRHNEMANNAAA